MEKFSFVLEVVLLIISMIALLGSFSVFIVELFKKGYKNIKWTLPVTLLFIYIITYIPYLVISN